MRKKSITSRFQSLSSEKKILTLTSALAAIACFLPWYGINSRVINEWWNAFGSIGSVAGYIVFAFSLVTLVGLLLPVIRPELDLFKRLPVKESSAYMFLNGQSFFVSLIFIPVYSQYSLINATNSGTRFGLYIALASTLVGTIVATAHHRKAERLGLRTQEFATMPRTQQSLQDWSAEEETQTAPVEGLHQEEMFETAEESAPVTYTGYDQETLIEDTSETTPSEQRYY